MLERFPDLGPPDWGFAEDDPEVKVNKTQFGDGYVLRQPAGINHIRDKWSPGWSSLAQEEAEAAYAWLRQRKDITAFLWTHPITGVEHQVVCTSVSISYAGFDDTQLRVGLEKDFNPL